MKLGLDHSDDSTTNEVVLILYILILILLSYASFFMAKRAVNAQAFSAGKPLACLSGFYGWCGVVWLMGLLGLLTFFAADLFFLPEDSSLDQFAKMLIAVLGLFTIMYVITKKWCVPEFHARYHLEKIIKAILFISAFISISITLMIVVSVLFESVLFFKKVPFFEFLFGTEWNPQSTVRAGETSLIGTFGVVPLFAGTLMITLIAMIVALPVGLLSAIYLSEFSSKKTRARIKPILEMLAGIPTVVYGYFAVKTLAPLVRDLGITLDLDIDSESALVAGTVMGIMIIPFILSLSDDAMHAVPQSLRDASLALGSTNAETVTKVVVPAALPGIMGAILLAISRAIGETMIVVMAASTSANLTANPFESVTTVTTQIVTLLVGDQEFDSPKTLAAFALGLTLFVITLLMNIVSLHIVRKYKEQYD